MVSLKGSDVDIVELVEQIDLMKLKQTINNPTTKIFAGTYSTACPHHLTKEEKSLGYRIVTEHGPIYSVLVYLGLVD